MAFKGKLPIVASVGLLAVAAVAAIVFLGPTDEDLLQEAATRYAADLGEVREVQLHGAVADIRLDTGMVIHAEFSKKAGKWEFSKDLFKDFERHIVDPAVERRMFDRLGSRLNQRFRTSSVKFQGKDMEKIYRVDRGPASLNGMVRFDFGYPKVAERQARGRYIERFVYRERRWEFEGKMGVLMDRAPER